MLNKGRDKQAHRAGTEDFIFINMLFFSHLSSCLFQINVKTRGGIQDRKFLLPGCQPLVGSLTEAGDSWGLAQKVVSKMTLSFVPDLVPNATISQSSPASCLPTTRFLATSGSTCWVALLWPRPALSPLRGGTPAPKPDWGCSNPKFPKLGFPF